MAAVAAAGLAGCGGGGADATMASVEAAAAAPVAAAATPAPAPAAVAPAPAPTPAPAAPLSAQNVLTLDLAALADYTPVLPAYYDATVAALDNAPAGTPTSNAVATLGRVLFHDKRLSVNDTISCASCHQQALGFGDSRRFSVGFSGNAFTTAHSMRLGNVRYWQPGSMFWDRRAATLEAQATQPIQHPVEMGFDATNGGLEALFSKLRALPYYTELFTLAYGDADITEARVQGALAQFQRALVSTNSRWDAGYAQVFNAQANDRGLNTPVPGLSAAENRGRQLFIAGPQQGGAGCAACHQPPSFALAANSRSNGLDAGETTLFKSPALKNVGLSAAFMHDGRFSTLEQVVAHYDSGVQDGPALDNRLRGDNGQPRRLNLNAADQAALVAFLRTLTDESLVRDARFASPFRAP
jgi:cytochrome c peroxidase